MAELTGLYLPALLARFQMTQWSAFFVFWHFFIPLKNVSSPEIKSRGEIPEKYYIACEISLCTSVAKSSKGRFSARLTTLNEKEDYSWPIGVGHHKYTCSNSDPFNCPVKHLMQWPPEPCLLLQFVSCQWALKAGSVLVTFNFVLIMHNKAQYLSISFSSRLK